MKLTQYRLIFLVSLFFLLFDNFSFFKNVLKVYPFADNSYYVISVGFFLLSFLVLLFTLISSRYTTKPILIIALITSSLTSYFMDTYQIVIDSSMIRNTLQTNVSESLDLFSAKLFLYLIFLGILPSFLVYKVKLEYKIFFKEIFSKLRVLVLSVILIVIIFLSFSKFYTSFFREHLPLRYYTNPSYWIYNIGDYIAKTYYSEKTIFKEIGLDAKIEKTQRRKIVIVVVGEALRADRFSLNGYKKNTNPLLSKKEIINFSNFYSCGTSTAHSVPCMFSVYNRDDYTYKKGISTQNVLDVIARTKKVDILWRDNNSNSKGVALRVDYENYKNSKNNTICKDECRDEGMLVGLNDRIKSRENRDILIVLHQMGNHGPAYFKRYPKEFEKFKPTCKSNQIEQCSREEVSNAYDNAVLYTDYFLSKVIEFLQPYSKQNDTVMIYMSDHGESLGEGGIYLHGLPYFFAPDAQKHIASVMWFGDNLKINIKKIKRDSSKRFSHDNLFHTLLGLFEVKTKIYKKEMDMLK